MSFEEFVLKFWQSPPFLATSSPFHYCRRHHDNAAGVQREERREREIKTQKHKNREETTVSGHKDERSRKCFHPSLSIFITVVQEKRRKKEV